MPSADHGGLAREHRQILLELARRSIEYGLHGNRLSVNVKDYPQALQTDAASFVTLTIHGRLRGCIGSLEPHQPLVSDVVARAYAAAFKDPRFAALSEHEFADIDIHISVLSEPEVINFLSEADLLKQLRPGIDGLILQDGSYRGTFLPSVWESLPEPCEFLRQLKQKAGLEPDYWSDTIQIKRYITESLS